MLHIENLQKRYTGSGPSTQGDVLAVNNIHLEVKPGQMYCLLGPSGCGKTTTLRCIAGLEDPDAGEISVSGKVLFSSAQGINVEPDKRGLGMVFQSYAIWPHMSVYDNVAFPLKVPRRSARRSPKENRERVERVLNVVRLGHLAGRPATDLSGGQQQRLALARALVSEPPLILLDEPLSNLDAQLREEMRFELRRLQLDLNITAVYVTHDQVEALAMSSVIAVMNEGNIEQIGTPEDIYTRPQSRFVADFIGTANFLAGTVVSRGGDRVQIKTEVGPFEATSDLPYISGDNVVLSVRPEHIQLDTSATDTTGPGAISGMVTSRSFLGESVEHIVAVGALEIRVRCHQSISIAPGNEVTLRVPPEVASLVPAN